MKFIYNFAMILTVTKWGEEEKMKSRIRSIYVPSSFLIFLILLIVSWSSGIFAEQGGRSTQAGAKSEKAKAEESGKRYSGTDTVFVAKDIEYAEKKTIPLQEVFGTSKPWHVTAQEDKDIKEWDYFENPNATDRPARICFWTDPDKKDQKCEIAAFKECYHTPTHLTCGPVYTFQFFKDMKIVDLKKAGKPNRGILFTVENWGYHLSWARHRTLTLFSIWTYDEKTGDFKRALELALTEQGEFKYSFPASAKLDGVAVGADFFWDLEHDEGGRYGMHRYIIDIHRLTEKGEYKWIGAYRTDKKYKSLGDSEDSVIEQELANIRKVVRKNTKKK
jgi:hypothetical protein